MDNKLFLVYRSLFTTSTSQSLVHNLFGLFESFHKLNKPKSVSYRILVWTGLFIRVFERAHECTKKLNEAMSGS